MKNKIQDLEKKIAEAQLGGGAKRIESQHKKGKLTARERLHFLMDEGTFEEWDGDLRPADPLQFHDQKPYAERLVAEQKRTGLSDAA